MDCKVENNIIFVFHYLMMFVHCQIFEYTFHTFESMSDELKEGKERDI